MNTDRTLRILVGIVSLGVAPAAAAPADIPAVDPRWRAWIGCWLAADVHVSTPDAPEAERLVCVLPTENRSTVTIATVGGGATVARERIEATGERRPSQRDGCAGWEHAQWSADGLRVYMASEHDCGEGVVRRTSGLIGFTENGDWLDVVEVTAGKATGVRVLRHNPAGPGDGMPAEIAAALDGQSGSETAALAASAPVGLEAITEASLAVSPAVAVAWLSELGHPISLDAKRLLSLDDAGVPGEVIDVLVALAHPEIFSVKPALAEIADAIVAALETEPDPDPVYRDGYSLYGWDRHSPVGRSHKVDRHPDGDSRAPRGSPSAGWHDGNQPVTVVARPPQHGWVQKGLGYLQGLSAPVETAPAGSSSTKTEPPTTTTTSATSSSPAASSSSSSSSSSSKSPASSDSSSSSSSKSEPPTAPVTNTPTVSDSGERTAKPR